MAHVHRNPVSAGIVEDPADYRFSGHRELVGLCPPRVVDKRSALLGFRSTASPWGRISCKGAPGSEVPKDWCSTRWEGDTAARTWRREGPPNTARNPFFQLFQIPECPPPIFTPTFYHRLSPCPATASTSRPVAAVRGAAVGNPDSSRVRRCKNHPIDSRRIATLGKRPCPTSVV